MCMHACCIAVAARDVGGGGVGPSVGGGIGSGSGNGVCLVHVNVRRNDSCYANRERGFTFV